MKSFQITGVDDPESSATDRQERINWWKQRSISDAKIMVIGAGAIGNETLKNLALLGCRYLFVVDFDTVSRSNLSRTVLFRREDIGLRKAEVAARRVREFAVAEDFQIDWFHGDVAWELGVGVYQAMDLVLGCLDNVEARLAVNRNCWLAGKPWIDAGIRELACRVNVYRPPSPPCYECGVTPEDLVAASVRYSCDRFKQAMNDVGKVATVQVASALVSALQVQEAIKLLCDQPNAEGKKLYFDGKLNDFDLFKLTPRGDCDAHHLSYPALVPLPLNHRHTVRELLEVVSHPDRSGSGAVLSLRGQHQFLERGSCRGCGRDIDFLRPNFRIHAAERFCPECQTKGLQTLAAAPEKPMEVVECKEFSLEETSSRLLGLTLHEIGVPYCGVTTVIDPSGRDRYYRLDDDRPLLFPSLFSEPKVAPTTLCRPRDETKRTGTGDRGGPGNDQPTLYV
jgi:molybdopterin/thiamine biosynthesis adenylyltransferase